MSDETAENCKLVLTVTPVEMARATFLLRSLAKRWDLYSRADVVMAALELSLRSGTGQEQQN